MKTKKLLLPSIIPLVIALFTVILTGCTYTKEERAERQKIVETAKQNAAHYIKEKYGFDNAKITKALNINKGQPGGLLYTARPASGYIIPQQSIGIVLL